MWKRLCEAIERFWCPTYRCGRCGQQERSERRVFPLCRSCWKVGGLDKMSHFEQVAKTWGYLPGGGGDVNSAGSTPGLPPPPSPQKSYR